MILPTDFAKIQTYCQQHDIYFLPDSEEAKLEGTPFLVLQDKQLRTWYPSCYSVEDVRKVCKEIDRQRRLKQVFQSVNVK